jgi:hypothetical protein
MAAPMQAEAQPPRLFLDSSVIISAAFIQELRQIIARRFSV